MGYHIIERFGKTTKNFDKVPGRIKKLSIIFFIYIFGSKLCSFFIPVYVQNLTGGYALSGIVVSLLGAGMIFIDIPIGELMERVGRKTVLYIGLFVRSLSGLAYGFSTGLFSLVSARIFDGVGVSFSWDSAWTIVRDESPEGLESESLAVQQTGAILASILGPILGGFLAMRWGLRYLFFVFSGLSLISLGITIFTFRGTKKGEEGLGEGLKDVIKKDKIVKSSIRDLEKLGGEGLIPHLLVFFYSINLSTVWFVVPLFSETLNANFLVMGLLFGCMYLPGILKFWFSELSDRIGDKKSVFYFSILGLFFSIPLVFVQNLWTLFALVVGFSTFLQAQNPSIGALLTKISPKEEMGELTGVYQTFKHFGFFIGPFLAGGIAELYGISAPFGLSAVMLILMAIISSIGGFDM